MENYCVNSEEHLKDLVKNAGFTNCSDCRKYIISISYDESNELIKSIIGSIRDEFNV